MEIEVHQSSQNILLKANTKFETLREKLMKQSIWNVNLEAEI